MTPRSWTEDDVRRILSNPVYVGMGPFPRLIADDLWIAAQHRRVKEEGVKPVLQSIRAALHETLDLSLPFLADPAWLDDASQRIARNGLDASLRALLAQLRAELDEPTPKGQG